MPEADFLIFNLMGIKEYTLYVSFISTLKLQILRQIQVWYWYIVVEILSFLCTFIDHKC